MARDVLTIHDAPHAAKVLIAAVAEARGRVDGTPAACVPNNSNEEASAI